MTPEEFAAKRRGIVGAVDRLVGPLDSILVMMSTLVKHQRRFSIIGGLNLVVLVLVVIRSVVLIDKIDRLEDRLMKLSSETDEVKQTSTQVQKLTENQNQVQLVPVPGDGGTAGQAMLIISGPTPTTSTVPVAGAAPPHGVRVEIPLTLTPSSMPPIADGGTPRAFADGGTPDGATHNK